MRTPASGLKIDSPAWPLLQAQISYWDLTSAAGNALGTTLVCGNLANEPSYAGLPVKILDGPAAGQVRQIAVHAGNTLIVAAAWTNAAGAVQQIAASTRFCILSAAGGGGAPPPAPPSPSVGLWMFGICDPGMAASLNTLVLTNLAGFNDDLFNNEFWVQVIHNTSAPGTAPEREIRRVTDYVGATGTFTTDAFSANVEANDLVAVFHESIMAVEILGYGTLDTSSATVPADSTRGEVDNYFNGHLLMATEGAVRFQPRRIVDYTGAGGIFTLDPNNPFTGVPGQVDYIIIRDQAEFVPAADGANNRTPADVMGNKASTAIYTKDGVSDLVRYVKGLLDATITAWGTADAGSGVGLVRDAARTEANDWWNGQTLLMLTGAAAFQKRPITDFLAATDDIVIAPNFDAAVGAGDIYVILAHYNQIVPRAADDIQNALTSQVVGRKDDTADYTPGATQSSLVRFLKGILGTRVVAEGTLTLSSATVPEDNANAAIADSYNGLLLMPVAGACAFLPRRILDWTAGTGVPGTGVFTIDPNNPFPAATGTVAYVVLADQTEFIPTVDGAINRTPSDVVGGKADTPITTPDNVSSTIRYLKGTLNAVNEKPEWAAPTTGTHTTIGITEETIVETAYTDPFLFYMLIDLVNMVAGDDFTLRIYQRVDSINFRLKAQQQFVGAQTIDVYELDGLYGDTACDIRVTIQRASGTNRSFPFRHNILKEP